MTDTISAPLADDRRAYAAAREVAGDFEGAVHALQSFVAAHPSDADAWYDLGRMLRRMNRLEDALAAYDRALALGASDPWQVHLNRSVIYASDLRQPVEAEAELAKALALKPDYVPALINRGNLFEDQGQREQAHAAYASALELEPTNPMALSRMAGLKTAPVAADDALITRLRSAISNVTGTDNMALLDRADMGFALGRLLDLAESWDDAFAAYSAANAASAGIGASVGRAAQYNRAATEQLVDRLIAATPAPVAPLDDDAAIKAPVFICGMFRSGSTLVEQILGAHPDVAPGGELDLLPAIARNVFNPFPEALGVFDTDSRRKIREAYIGGLNERVPGATTARVVTDKRPDNILYLGLAKTLFPHARIIHTVREPLDNVLSVFFLHLSHAMPYALDLEDTAHWLAQERRLAAHWKSLWADDMLEVSYDDLVSRQEPVVRDILAFCGLDWNPAVMDFHTRGNAVRTASVWQVREPMHGRSSGRARHYEKHLGGARAALETYGL